MGWLQENEAGKKALKFDRMSKGWAVGTRAPKKELLKEHGDLVAASGRTDQEPRELWGERARRYLVAVKKTARDLGAEAKGAPWKVAIAAAMKASTTASNPWLAAP